MENQNKSRERLTMAAIGVSQEKTIGVRGSAGVEEDLGSKNAALESGVFIRGRASFLASTSPP